MESIKKLFPRTGRQILRSGKKYKEDELENQNFQKEIWKDVRAKELVMNID